MSVSAKPDVGRVVQASAKARRSGLPADGLRLVEAVLADLPDDSLPLRLEVARNLSEIPGRFDDTIASWMYCIDTFRDAASFGWFLHCRKAIEEKFRRSRIPEHLEARIRLIEDLHERALAIWPGGAAASEEQAEVAQQVMAWVSEWRTYEDGSLDAFERHFALFPDATPARLYTHYVQQLYMDPVPGAAGKFDDYLSYIETKFPSASLSDPNVNAADQRKAQRVWTGILRVLMKAGQIELAGKVMARLPDDFPEMADLRAIEGQLRKQITAEPADGAAPPPLDYNSENSIVTWSPAKPSDRVIYVFTNGKGRFFFALAFFHKLLENLGCHLVYLTDTRDEFFLRGEGWATPAQLIENLREIATDLGATRRYALGASSGAYAALRYGIGLEVEGILAFNPPFVSPKDLRLPGTQLMFQNLGRALPGEELDLVEYYAAADSIPPVTVAVSEGCEHDLAAAEQMAVFPQVQLAIAEGATKHASIKDFVAQGRFFPMVEALLSGRA